jgi:hypothetical protein
MSAPSGITVRSLLPDKFRRIDEAIDQGRKDDPEFQMVKVPGVALSVAGEKASDAVTAALDFDVFELVAQAWAKARELEAHAKETLETPGKTATLFLGSHSLTCDIHPIVKLTFGALGTLPVRFTLALEAAFDMAEVTLLGGRIVKIGRSQGQGSAVLKYGGTELHDRLKTREFPLTAPISLAAPGVLVAIKPARD